MNELKQMPDIFLNLKDRGFNICPPQIRALGHPEKAEKPKQQLNTGFFQSISRPDYS